MNRYINTIMLCCGTALLFAGSYIGSKYLQAFMHPYSYTAARVGLATLFLLPFIKMREFAYIKYRYVWAFLGVGFFGYFLTNHLFTVALHYAPSTNISIISSTLPIMMLITSCFLAKRYPTFNEVTAFGCTFVGMLLIICKKDISSLSLQKGEMLMLLSNCAGIANNLLLAKLGRYFTSLFLTAMGGAVGMLFLSPLGLTDHLLPDMGQLGGFEWMALIAVAVLCTALPFWGLSQAIITVGPNTATFLVMGLSPVFVAVLSYIFFGEPITGTQMLGGALVVLALYFNIRSTMLRPIKTGGW